MNEQVRQKKIWKTKWSLSGDTTWKRSGGQGTLQLVCPAHDPDAAPSVLKELHKQNDMDRRQRMRREVVVLETLPHSSTPRVLDHNTVDYKELDVDLYAIFEFIDGPTLAEHIKEHGPLALENAVALVMALLEILAVYHEQGIGHRDIKPDNIILRGGKPESPCLIDFGLTFNADIPGDEDTPDWQQVGNRFLALPEHVGFSENKRELRSDLTFCVGILFFVLTGTYPSTLVDENGRLPHQRAAARAILDRIPEQRRLTLLSVFDVGFSAKLGQRWQSIAALRDQLGKIASSINPTDATGAILADLRARASAKSGNQEIINALDLVRRRIKQAGRDAVSRLGAGYAEDFEEKITNMSDMSTWIRCGVSHVYDGGLTNTRFSIRMVGGEVLVQDLDGEGHVPGAVRFRLPLEAPDAIPELHETIVRIVIENVGRGVAGNQ